MKKYFFLFCGFAFFISCTMSIKDKKRSDRIMDDKQQQLLEIAKRDTTSVYVIDSMYNFGTIKEGALVEHNFMFINTGHKPLVFPQEPIASCGCTVPQRPDKPVFPGDTSFIRVVFNSKGKSNHVVKTVTVISNAFPSFPQLVLTGDIQKSE